MMVGEMVVMMVDEMVVMLVHNNHLLKFYQLKHHPFLFLLYKLMYHQ